MRKLEVGSGNRPLEGYDHLDIDPKLPHLEIIAPMDEIPVGDGTYDEISAIHVIEHQSWRDAKKILTEWFRVLSPKGLVYIATPNLKFITEMYIDGVNGGSKWMKDYSILHPTEQEHIKIDGVPSLARWANFKIFSSTSGNDRHYACYDAVSLTRLLKDVGFKTVTIQNDSDSLVLRAFK